MTFGAGEIVFVKHPKHSWVVGNVVACDKASATVKCNDPQREVVGETLDKVKIDDVTPCREDLLDEAPDDLLTLTVLHDATLLRCLHSRYFRDIVYTNIGAIVVALNPFNFKIPYYMDDQMPKYLAEGSIIERNLPHSWAQAHNTYNEMIVDGSNQCILISGESGAGKTEATKIVMKYLAQISCKRGTEEEKKEGLLVGHKLNSCSPILEAFGNARTVRNDNSSRFGKFMKVKFRPSGQICGSHTTKYLLEKSRIVTCSLNERCYHSFYIVVRGHLASAIGLQDISTYKSVNAGKCVDNSEFSTAADFKEVCDAMKTMGMSDQEVSSVWFCTGGILSALNVEFKEKGEGSEVAEATRSFLRHAVSCWKIDPAGLEKELLTSTLVIPGGETATKVLRPALAVDVRDALCKALYNGMFGWLVEKSNAMCDVDVKGNWIGLLDIFGFEDFQHNSFEQLCINLANETLQNHYNTYIFDKDMAECRAEGIDVTEVKCPDNMPCLKLITDKGGIIALLDEECILGKGTDVGFLEKVEQANGKHPFFDKKKSSRDTFVIHHYAASVTYDVKGWLEKNRDTVKDDVRRLMRNSTDPLIKLFLEEPQPDQKSKRTVGGFFRDQVGDLMAVINSTNPHWIRCVKPHPAKKARMFDGVSTMNQLESSGVLGTVKIRKAGYPIRMSFDKFNVRYKIIVGKVATQKNGKDLSKAVLEAVSMVDKKFAQIGKTKIFMKSEAFPLIERKRNEFLLGSAMRLQRFGRGLLERLRFNRHRAVVVQQRQATLLTIEYRDYMKRSAAEREERARLRREAEIKFRGLRQACQDAAIAALEDVYAGWQKTFDGIAAERDRVVLEERQRLERTRGEREAFQRQEYLARMRIFDEFAGHTQYLSELYAQEIQLFYRLELGFMEERDAQVRAGIVQEEVDQRARLRQRYMVLHTRGQLDATELRETAARKVLQLFETLQRQELLARISIMRHERSMMQHYRSVRHEDKKEAKLRAHHRHQYERWKEQELFRYEQLRRDELHRLYSAQAAASPIAGQHSAAAAAFFENIDQALVKVETRSGTLRSHGAAAAFDAMDAGHTRVPAPPAASASERLAAVSAAGSAAGPRQLPGAEPAARGTSAVPSYEDYERQVAERYTAPQPPPPAQQSGASGSASAPRTRGPVPAAAEDEDPYASPYPSERRRAQQDAERADYALWLRRTAVAQVHPVWDSPMPAPAAARGEAVGQSWRYASEVFATLSPASHRSTSPSSAAHATPRSQRW
jgi:myosin heavy subunit